MKNCFSALVFGLAIAVRLGGPAAVGPYDDAYHLKRIAYESGHEVTRLRGHEVPGADRLATSKPRDLVTHGLTALDFDLDRGIHGAFCPWPPLYDLAMGGIARLVGMAAIVWVAPLLFAAFATALTFVLWPRSGAAAALVAGCGVALAPYLIGISRIDSIDHHWVEPMLAVAILAAAIRRSATGLAIAMTAALFVQTALIVACGLALIAIVVVDRSVEALRAGTIAFAISGAAVVAYALTRPPAYPGGAWFLGTTHAALLAAGTVACGIGWLLARRCHSERSEESGGVGGAQPEIVGPRAAPPAQIPRYARNDTPARVSFGAAAAALLFSGLLLLPVARSLTHGAHFFAGDPWLRSIVEFQPMFRDPSRIGTDLANLGGGVLALIIAIAAARQERSRARAVVLLFALTYAMLAISSRRFLVPGIALFVIAGAFAASSRNRRIAAAAIALTLVPPVVYDIYAAMHPEPAATDGVVELAAEVAPLPAGRVLAPWHAGHAIDVFGRHAVVIDNFGSMPDAALFAAANRALLATSPDALRSWCSANGVRYLALADPDRHLPAAAVCAGVDPRTTLAARTVWARLWRGERMAHFGRVAPHVWIIE